MGYFVMRRGPYQGRLYRLDDEEITIGRGTRNTITIHDNEVSREHVRLVRVQDGFELQDLGSSNGTFVNGQKVDEPWLLRSHCIVELGDSITLEYWPVEPPKDLTSTDFSHPPGGEASYLLVHTPSGSEPAVYPLENTINTVGRSKENTIVIVEPEVSRQHFCLRLTRDGYVLEDMGSTNGTLLNGRRLEDLHLLKKDDVFQIGTTVYFQLTNNPEGYTNRVNTDKLTDTSRLDETERRRPGRIRLPQHVESGKTGELSLQDRVLVAYARSEWDPVAKPLVQYLRGTRIIPWVEQSLAEGTRDWATAVEQARLECWLLVIILSPAALESEVVRKHWWHFRNREKPIILLEYAPVGQMPIGSENLIRIPHSLSAPLETFKRVQRTIERYY